MPKACNDIDTRLEDVVVPGPRELFLSSMGFGLLAGWLELGLVLTLQAFNPRVLSHTMRMNRHVAWMVPVSDVLLFSVVGLAIALLARFHRRLARWIALRSLVALSALTLLLNIEGLHGIACVTLACGLGSVIGGWLERRSERLVRLVRVSVSVMAVIAVAWTGVSYARVMSAESRVLSRSPAAKPGAPNVLLIVLDTVRASSLSLYGHSRPTTPNLERLARKGVVFTEARSTSPWTSPTHASMLTGRWAHELSVAPGVPLDGAFPTLAEVLGREGYATAGFVGNIFYCNSFYGFGRGFNRFEDAYENQTVSLFETVWSSALGKRVFQALGYPTYPIEDDVSLRRKTAEMLNRDVLSWIADRPADRPFFAFVNYYDAHRPYVLDGDPKLRFGTAGLPIDERRKIDERFQDAVAGKPLPPGLTPEWISRDYLDLFRDSYDSRIAYLDQQVGLLLDEIERRGLLENTLVVVTSDHGEAMGEHGLIIHGASVYREEIHVPLLVIPPSRAAASKTVSQPVSLREIPATVAEWVDLGPRNPFPGRSLTRFLTEAEDQQPDTSPVLCELQHNIAFPPNTPIPAPFGPATSLVSRNLVYIRKNDGSEELYDLATDLKDSVNLANEPHLSTAIDKFREELRQVRGGQMIPPIPTTRD